MRYEKFLEKRYYHVCCGGAGGDKIFLDDEDRVRFIFLLTHFVSPARIYNSSWYTHGFLKNKVFSTQKYKRDQILKERNIELLAFTITDNKFDILLRNLEEGALSVYMQRILTAYGKYFNAKYKKRGHVFEGPFKAAWINKNADLADLSAYIHKQIDSKEGQVDLLKYPYSSYQDYTGINRWGELLSLNIIMSQFKNQSEYKNFVEKFNKNIK